MASNNQGGFQPLELGAQGLIKAQFHGKPGVWLGWFLGRRLSLQVVQLWGEGSRA